SEIDGELQSLGGTFTQDEGAVIRGGVSQGFNTRDTNPNPGAAAGLSVVNAVLSAYRMLTESVLTALGIGLVALLVVLIWPEPTARVRAAVQNAPGQSGALGLLAVIAVPVLIFITMIPVCLIPIGFMAGVVLTVAIAFGWIAVGELL